MPSLYFDIIEPRSVAMRRGEASLYSRDVSWVSFKVAPDRIGYPRQIIWLVSEENSPIGKKCRPGSVRDGKRHRMLTDETDGFLRLRCFHGQQVEGNSEERDGISWCFEHSSSDFYQAECYEIQVTLSEADFDKIILLISAGRYPSSIYVHTEEIPFGNAPDASDREWNLSDSSFAAITGCFISTDIEPTRVLVGPKPTEAEEEAAAERESEAARQSADTANGVAALCSGLASTNALLNAALFKSSALILLVAAVLVVAVLDYLRR